MTLPLTETANPRTADLDLLPTEELVRRINDEDATVAGAVRACCAEIACAIDRIAVCLRRGGRMIYVGAGTSGRIGVLDAAECLPTFGMPPERVFGIIAGGSGALLKAVENAEDDAVAGARAMDDALIDGDDAVIGLSASGGAPYVIAALRRARERGALITVAVSCVPNAPLSATAEIAIETVTGPEVLTGSTRLKAGTAQKMVCNLLSTGAMVKIGKTYGNKMVDVQATNAKLVLRSRRLLREVGGVTDDTEAARLLAAAGGGVKRAIVMARRGVDAGEAARLLAAAGDRLGAALGEA